MVFKSRRELQVVLAGFRGETGWNDGEWKLKVLQVEWLVWTKDFLSCELVRREVLVWRFLSKFTTILFQVWVNLESLSLLIATVIFLSSQCPDSNQLKLWFSFKFDSSLPPLPQLVFTVKWSQTTVLSGRHFSPLPQQFSLNPFPYSNELKLRISLKFESWNFNHFPDKFFSISTRNQLPAFHQKKSFSH
jgi:hypothetical protein